MGAAGKFGTTNIYLGDIPVVEDLTLIPSVALSSRATPAPNHAQWAVFQSSFQVMDHSLGHHEPLLWPKTRCRGYGYIFLGQEQA